MTISKKAWTLLLMASASTIMVGCAAYYPQKPRPSTKFDPDGIEIKSISDIEKYLYLAGKELDVVARYIDEFGVISASAAPLIESPGEIFKFDLDLTPNQIFEEERVQGFSAVRSYEELAVRLAASVALMRAGNTQEAHQAMASALMSAEENGVTAPPAEGEGAQEMDNQRSFDDLPESPDLPDRPPRATPGQFSPALATPNPDDALEISLRDLLKRTFDDYATLKIFEWMSAPNTENLGTNKKLYAAILNVNIRPGRSTYRGYNGQVDISFNYSNKDCLFYTESQRTCFQQIGGLGEAPSAFAVFPALDSQTLDLRNSRRRQFALSMILQAAFSPNPAVQGAGSLGVDFNRLLEGDAATITQRNTVVGYNVAGRNFGWYFSPSFVAQSDITGLDTPPDIQLQAQSFPAVILLIADKNVLASDVGGTGVKNKWDGLEMTYTHKWLRAPDPRGDNSWVPFSGRLSRASTTRIEEANAIDFGIRLARAERIFEAINCYINAPVSNTLNQVCKNILGVKNTGEKDQKKSTLNASIRYNKKSTFNPILNSLRDANKSLQYRIHRLRAESVGTSIYVSLPEVVAKSTSPKPTLTLKSGSPQRIWSNKPNYIVVSGSGFQKANGKPDTRPSKFYIGGFTTTLVDASDDGKAAVLQFDPAGKLDPEFEGSLELSVYRDGGGSASLDTAIAVRPNKAPTTPDSPDKRIQIEWTLGSNGQAYPRTIHTYDDVTIEDVVKAISAGLGTQTSISLDDVKVKLETK